MNNVYIRTTHQYQPVQSFDGIAFKSLCKVDFKKFTALSSVLPIYSGDLSDVLALSISGGLTLGL